ncbi:MAG: putative sugar nucleotidyl transferase [Phycisphaerae bacterium]
MPGTFLFDDRLPSLSPLADLRPAWDIRTGALTTLERIEATLGRSVDGLACGDDIAPVARERDPRVLSPSDAPAGLYLNARCVAPPDAAFKLAAGETLIDGNGATVAAMVDAAAARRLLAGDASGLRAVTSPAPMLARPWHVRTHRDACLARDMALLAARIPFAALPSSCVAFGPQRLHVAASARLFPGVTFDLESGPIVIDERAVIRPGAQLIGPCYVGQDSTILERATIRPGTAVGPVCKVNGEVGGTIFQGFSNKAHDGYVGDSYLGEWVNLGAGTTTSNLLNTYGEIIAKASPSLGNERTGLQYLGSVVGDHVKTAICTRLMTGTVVHTGAMIATTSAASGCVPAFAWCTDAGTRSFRLDKFTEIMRTAMGRRKVEPGEAYVARIANLHRLAVESSPKGA